MQISEQHHRARPSTHQKTDATNARLQEFLCDPTDLSRHRSDGDDQERADENPRGKGAIVRRTVLYARCLVRLIDAFLFVSSSYLRQNRLKNGRYYQEKKRKSPGEKGGLPQSSKKHCFERRPVLAQSYQCYFL